MFIYDNLTNDYLPEDTQEQATKVRLEDREFLKLVQQIEKLSEEDNTVIKIFQMPFNQEAD